MVCIPLRTYVLDIRHYLPSTNRIFYLYASRPCHTPKLICDSHDQSNGKEKNAAACKPNIGARKRHCGPARPQREAATISVSKVAFVCSWNPAISHSMAHICTNDVLLYVHMTHTSQRNPPQAPAITCTSAWQLSRDILIGSQVHTCMIVMRDSSHPPLWRAGSCV